MAIGVEGGFNPDANKKKFEYEDTNSVVILPAFDVIPLPNPDLPELVSHTHAFLSCGTMFLHMCELSIKEIKGFSHITELINICRNLKELDEDVKKSEGKCAVLLNVYKN